MSSSVKTCRLRPSTSTPWGLKPTATVAPGELSCLLDHTAAMPPTTTTARRTQRAISRRLPRLTMTSIQTDDPDHFETPPPPPDGLIDPDAPCVAARPL